MKHCALVLLWTVEEIVLSRLTQLLMPNGEEICNLCLKFEHCGLRSSLLIGLVELLLVLVLESWGCRPVI